MGFGQATELSGSAGTYHWEVPDGWQQGRGAWGGLVAGGIVRAVEATEADPDRRLRTLTVHMSAPLPVGPAQVRVDPLRIGSGMSTWAVTVQHDGGLVAHAVAITGAARAPDLAAESRTWGTVERPQLPAPDAVPPVPAGVAGMPTFLQHIEMRVAVGVPLSGSAARCSGYVTLVEPQPWDAAGLIALVDAWFPTALMAVDAIRPFATVAFCAHLLVDPATVPADEPLAYEASLSAVHDGYTSEIRRLWTGDGRLAVENHQSIAVIR